NDHVCVAPGVREQARRDNLDPAARRNEVRAWITTYSSQTRVCSGGACHYVGDGVSRMRVNVDRLNVGSARVVLYDARTGRPLKWWDRQVAAHAFAPGGFLAVDTGWTQCTGTLKGYFVVQDLVSRIVS